MAIYENPDAERWFVPKSERYKPEGEQFAVLLKVFTDAEMARLENIIGKKRTRLGDFNRRVLDEGVLGWRNFRRKIEHPEPGGRDWEEVPFEGPSSVRKLRPAIRREVLQELLDVNEVDEDDEGN